MNGQLPTGTRTVMLGWRGHGEGDTNCIASQNSELHKPKYCSVSSGDISSSASSMSGGKQWKTENTQHHKIFTTLTLEHGDNRHVSGACNIGTGPKYFKALNSNHDTVHQHSYTPFLRMRANANIQYKITDPYSTGCSWKSM